MLKKDWSHSDVKSYDMMILFSIQLGDKILIFDQVTLKSPVLV